MSQPLQFRAIIQDAGDGGAYVVVPFDVEQVFGKKRVKVNARIEGVAYRGSLVRMGTPDHILIILKEIRQQIGKTFGDEIAVEIEEDTAPRVVEIPTDLRSVLDGNPQAAAFFQQLSFSHQREYVQWIDSAKRPETRQKRIEKTVELLIQGQRAP